MSLIRNEKFSVGYEIAPPNREAFIWVEGCRGVVELELDASSNRVTETVGNAEELSAAFDRLIAAVSETVSLHDDLSDRLRVFIDQIIERQFSGGTELEVSIENLPLEEPWHCKTCDSMHHSLVSLRVDENAASCKVDLTGCYDSESRVVDLNDMSRMRDFLRWIESAVDMFHDGVAPIDELLDAIVMLQKANSRSHTALPTHETLGPNGAEVVAFLELLPTLTGTQWDAAWDAAAWDDARYVARYVARDAARDASRDAAWDAVWDVSLDAAWDGAARVAASALVVRDLITEEQFAILTAPMRAVGVDFNALAR